MGKTVKLVDDEEEIGNLKARLSVIPLWPIAPWGSSRLGGGDRNGSEAQIFKEIKLDLYARPDAPATSAKVGTYVKIFETGTPEQWCRWRDDLKRVWTGLRNTTGPSKAATVKLLTEGPAKDDFEAAIDLLGDHDDLVVLQALKAVAINIFPPDSVLKMKDYLTREARKPNSMRAREVSIRMQLLNSWFDYFPSDGGSRQDPVLRIPDHEMALAYFRCLPNVWKRKMDENNQFDLHAPTTTIRSVADYADRLETTEAVYAGSGGRSRGSANKQSPSKGTGQNGNSGSGGTSESGSTKRGGNRERKSSSKDCLIHGTNCGHSSHQCKLLIAHAEGARKLHETQKRYSNFGKPPAKKTQNYKSKRSEDRTYTRSEVQTMLKKLKGSIHESHNMEEDQVIEYLEDNNREVDLDAEMEDMLNEN